MRELKKQVVQEFDKLIASVVEVLKNPDENGYVEHLDIMKSVGTHFKNLDQHFSEAQERNTKKGFWR